MDNNKTDKKLLFKGIKTLAFALLSLFMGPILFHTVQSNQDKPLYYPLLIVSVLVCGMAVFMTFKGIKIIMSSMFKK